MRSIIIFLLLIFNLSVASAQDFDALRDSLSRATTEEERVDRLNALARAYSRKDPEQSRVFGHQALNLAILKKYGAGVAYSNLSIGISYKCQGNFADALKYETRALEQYRALNDKAGVANTQYALSILYKQHSDYKTAMEYVVEAREYFQEVKSYSQEANSIEVMGTLFFRQGDLQNAEKYYKLAVESYEDLGDTVRTAGAQVNLGMLLGAKGLYDEAMEVLKEAKELNEEYKNTTLLQASLNNMGLIDYKRGNYLQALTYLEKAYDLSKAQGNEVSVATTWGNMGAAYLGLAKNTERSALREEYLAIAKDRLTKSIKRCHELKAYDPTIEFYQYLAEVYQMQGYTELALEAYQKGAAIKDSIHSINNRIVMTNMTVSHELEMTNRDLQVKQQQLTIKELELEKSQQQIWLYAVSLVALVCLIGIAIYFLRQFRDRNKKLEQTNEKYAAKVEEQMSSLKKHTKVLNEIAYMQAHDVREPLSTILGLTENFNYEDPKHPDNAFIIKSLKMVTEKLDKAVREVIQKKEEL